MTENNIKEPKDLEEIHLDLKQKLTEVEASLEDILNRLDVLTASINEDDTSDGSEDDKRVK